MKKPPVDRVQHQDRDRERERRGKRIRSAVLVNREKLIQKYDKAPISPARHRDEPIDVGELSELAKTVGDLTEALSGKLTTEQQQMVDQLYQAMEWEPKSEDGYRKHRAAINARLGRLSVEFDRISDGKGLNDDGEREFVKERLGKLRSHGKNLTPVQVNTKNAHLAKTWKESLAEGFLGIRPEATRKYGVIGSFAEAGKRMLGLKREEMDSPVSDFERREADSARAMQMQKVTDEQRERGGIKYGVGTKEGAQAEERDQREANATKKRKEREKKQKEKEATKKPTASGIPDRPDGIAPNPYATNQPTLAERLAPSTKVARGLPPGFNGVPEEPPTPPPNRVVYNPPLKTSVLDPATPQTTQGSMSDVPEPESVKAKTKKRQVQDPMLKAMGELNKTMKSILVLEKKTADGITEVKKLLDKEEKRKKKDGSLDKDSSDPDNENTQAKKKPTAKSIKDKLAKVSAKTPATAEAIGDAEGAAGGPEGEGEPPSGGGGVVATAAATAAAMGVGGAAVKGAKALGGAAVKGAKALGGVVKVGGKSLPGIGAILAAGFVASRLADGDLFGVGVEGLSGLASLAPGGGTAASIALQGGLAVRDAKRGKVDPKNREQIDIKSPDTMTESGTHAPVMVGGETTNITNNYGGGQTPSGNVRPTENSFIRYQDKRSTRAL